MADEINGSWGREENINHSKSCHKMVHHNIGKRGAPKVHASAHCKGERFGMGIIISRGKGIILLIKR